MHVLLTAAVFMICYLFLEISQTVSNEPISFVTSLHYDHWLLLWKERLSTIPELPVAPPSACKINTPLNTKYWQHCLSTHLNQKLASWMEFPMGSE